ncbi:MAG: DUF2029 domain-containing protein [Phycisphaerae bacterium]|nr:DUF2029 domain-containing protein [Phycisphaerae bacterium]
MNASTDHHRASADAAGSPSRTLCVAAGVFFLAALAYFAWRGPWRAVQRTVDYPTFYAAARTWLAGGNPYDVDALRATYAAAADRDVDVLWYLNPPGTLPLLAAFGAMRFAASNLAWLAVSLALIAVIVRETGRLCGLRPRQPRFWLLAGFIVALAPFHTSISQGQLSIAVTACLLLALRCEMHRRDWLTGLLLAVAASLKPQMVFAFGLYYLLVGRWRVCVAGVVALVALTLGGIVPMVAGGVPWLDAWREGYAAANTAMNDPAATELGRYIVLSLPMLLHTWLDSAWLVHGITVAFLVFALAAAVWLGAVTRRVSAPWLYGLLALASLLGAYHRIYDATVLVLPIALAVGLWRRGRPRWAIAGLVPIAPMVVSGAAVLVVATRRQWIPPAVAESMLWRGFALPHVVWLVAILFVWTVAVGLKRHAEPPAP